MNWIAAALISSILWGLNYALGERLMKTLNISTLVLLYSFSNFLFAIVYNLYTKKIFSDIKVIHLNIAGILLGFVFSGIFANLLTYFATKEKNASLAGLIEICYPVFTAIIAYLLFGEKQLSSSSMIGAVFIFTGIILIAR